MLARLNHLIARFAGCVIASLFGLLLMLKLDAPILGMLCAASFPVLACRCMFCPRSSNEIKSLVFGRRRK